MAALFALPICFPPPAISYTLGYRLLKPRHA
jgi:hypothetical protein